MATYYWLGAVNGDVNNRYNWTLYGPGFTGPTAANSRPPAGSSIIFSKFAGVCGYAGITQLPTYGPSGFFYGATSSGSTAQYLVDVTVTPTYHKDLGNSTTNLSLFAKTINILRGVTSTAITNYLNVYPSPGASYSAYDSVVKVDARNWSPTSPTLKCTNYIEGTVKILQFGVNPGTTTGSDNYLRNLTVSDIIVDSSYGNIAKNNITIANTCTLTATNLVSNGSESAITISRGTAFNDGTITCANNSDLVFPPFGSSGPSGADNAVSRTYINKLVLNGNTSKPRVSFDHGVDLYNLFANGGYIFFNSDGVDPTIIRGGLFDMNNAKMESPKEDNVTILDNTNYSDGFIINTTSLGSRSPINLLGKYNLRLNNPVGYTFA